MNKNQHLKNLHHAIGMLCLFIFFNPNPAHPQEKYCVELITSEQGLSQNTVNCLLQDQQGFMWFGTQDGLNKYDGYRFEYYHNNPNDINSLSNNYILCMAEDHGGLIWVGTMTGGLNCLNKRTGNFIRFADGQGKNNLHGNTIWCVLNDHEDNIWAGTIKGLSMYDKNSKHFINFSLLEHSEDFPFKAVYSLYEDRDNFLWIGGESGILRFNNSTKKFGPLINVFELVNRPVGITWSICENTQGHLLLSTNAGLIEYDPLNHVARILTQTHTKRFTVWSSVVQDNGNIFIGTTDGISMIDHELKSCDPLVLEEINIPINNVWDFIIDKSGITWAGCNMGVVKIREKQQQFVPIIPDQKQSVRIPGGAVNTIMEDSGNNLWVGTEGGGLAKISFLQQSTEVFLPDAYAVQSIGGNKIWALEEDHEGKIWIGTYGDGLSVYNPVKQSFTHYRQSNQSNSINNSRVLVLLEDTYHDVWIGTRGGGLNVFRNESRSFEVYRMDAENHRKISSNTILSLVEDQFGFLWIGTFEGGLDQMDLRSGNIKNFANDPENQNSLSNNNIYAIHFDQSGGLWLGTQGGLNYVSAPYQDMLFHNLTTRQGLPSNVILGIEADENGNLWLSTYKGLVKLNIKVFQDMMNAGIQPENYIENPLKPLFKIFTRRDGTLNNEYNQGAHFKGHDGKLYFGGPDGLNYFYPDSITASRCNPDVVITDLKIFNQPVKIDANILSDVKDQSKIIRHQEDYYIGQKINFFHEIILSYRESFFAFEFSSLDFTDPARNRYAYFLEGFDSRWNFIGENTDATFTNLDPGEYTLKVKGTNADGRWSENEACLTIIITPPFYRTSWFILGIIVFLLLIMLLIIRKIISNQKKKVEKEREQMALQLKTIKNQMDPHFAFNAINMIGSMIYQEEPDAAYDYFSTFASLIRTTLNDSERIARSLGEELEFVNNYIKVQQKRFKNQFEFKLDMDERINLKTEIPKMILQVHIENAIKHGLMHKKGKGLLSISINLDGERLVISIADNGIGRKKSKELHTQGTQKGMEIIQQIFDLYNRLYKDEIKQQIVDLVDPDGNALGTKVIIIIQK